MTQSLYAIILAIFVVLSCSQENEVVAPRETEATLSDEEEDKSKERDNESGRVISFADAEVFFEFNTTDNDLGLQVFLDAEGWTEIAVMDAQGEEIVEVETEGKLSDLGITELRFESAEPSPAEVLALFPPGVYKFKGRTVEGDRLKSRARLSHDFVPAPTFTPSGGQVVDPANTTVHWNAPGAELVEVIIENEETDDVFDVIVSGEITSLDIPSQFLADDTEYKLEILSIAENGNRTIAESTFVTSGSHM